jgi:hypothetical protein
VDPGIDWAAPSRSFSEAGKNLKSTALQEKTMRNLMLVLLARPRLVLSALWALLLFSLSSVVSVSVSVRVGLRPSLFPKIR